MTTNSAWIKVDPERIIDALKHEAFDQIENGQCVVLDFSSVSRVDAGSLKALEGLAHLARERSAQIALQGVSLDIYKVLKLVKLTPHLSFMA
jgi:anti-anti-sigma regulatory factor